MGGFRSLAVGEEVEFQAVVREGKGWEAVAVRGPGGSEIRGQARWPGGGGGQANSRARKIRCFNCGNLARHLAADCPKPPLPKRCHHCKVKISTDLSVVKTNKHPFQSTAHLIGDCPALEPSKKHNKVLGNGDTNTSQTVIQSSLPS